MNSNSLRALEYDKIQHLLAEFAQTEEGRKACLQLMPDVLMQRIQERLDETFQAKSFIEQVALLRIPETQQSRSNAERIALGGVLTAEELYHMAQHLKALREIRESIASHQDAFLNLWKYATFMSVFKDIEQAIFSMIDDNCEIKTNATPELANVRKNIHQSRQLIYEKLENLLKASAYSKMFQEAIVTIRNHRYVVPLKGEFKSSIPCIVHDQSVSGETLYVEPLIITSLNNDYHILLSKEKKILDKILADLCELIHDRAKAIINTISISEQLDIIFAKARYAQTYQGTMPALSSQAELKFVRARHPLIPPDKVIPLSFELGKSFTTLILTGPNTGGKTVTLKTAGLLLVMTYSGLLLPADSDSVIGCFSDILADIGDEQSIEQSLSTFSSHVRALVNLTKEARPDTLALIDELGAGTDPDEGAAIGMSLISYLHREKVPLLVSTHLSLIKSFAYNHDRAINASMDFDLESLQPIYRILMGVPGQSHALHIAKKLGLPDEIMDMAKRFQDKNFTESKNMIDSLAKRTKEMEDSRNQSEKINQDLSQLKAEYEEKIEQIQNKYQRLKTDLQEKSNKEIRVLLDKAQELFSALQNKDRLDKEAHQIMGQIKEIRQEVAEAELRLDDLEELPKTPHPQSLGPSEEFSVMDNVYVPEYKKYGIVLKVHAKSKKAEIQMGQLRLNFSFNQLEKCESMDTVVDVDTTGVEQRIVHDKIDLIGFKVEEALEALEKYLQDAFLDNKTSVFVLHGLGTGALKDAIHVFLKKHPYVRVFDDRETATVVHFK
ncbi:MAG TPA: endonuclease MutS2 [Caldisericia bacterium]|nr:endonuclease MutS2 [Caldisericia bacterium]